MANNDVIQAKQVIDDLTASFDKHNESIEKVAKTLTSYENIIVELPSKYKQMIEVLTSGLNLAKQETQAIESNVIAVKANEEGINKLLAARKANISRTSEEIVNNRILAQNADNLTKQTSALAGAYGNLDAKAKEASKTLRDIIASGKLASETQLEYNSRLAKAQTEFDGYNKKLLEADKAVGAWSRSNIRSVEGLGQLTTGVTSFMNAFGLFTGIYLAAQAIKDAIGTTREFEKANADLAAYMGKTRAEITGLTDDQLRLTVATRYTATEIAEVQKELAKSGFNVEEIKQATPAILNFASAVGTDLKESVKVTDNILKVFNMRTSDTTKVTDVLAKSFTSSRLRINDFTEAMGYVAPTAKALNIPFEKVVSLLSAMANNGLVGSRAGTGLRRVIVDLTKSGGDFSEELDKMNAKQLTSQEAFKKFGRIGQTTALVINANSEQVKKLDVELNNVAGTADKMAKEQLDTLDGRIHILTSSWDAFIISISKGNGVFSKASKNLLDLVNNAIIGLSYLNESRLDERNRIMQDVQRRGYEEMGKVTKNFTTQQLKEQKEYNSNYILENKKKIEALIEENNSINSANYVGSGSELAKAKQILANREAIARLNNVSADLIGQNLAINEAIMGPIKKPKTEAEKEAEKEAIKAAEKAEKERLKIIEENLKLKYERELSDLERKRQLIDEEIKIEGKGLDQLEALEMAHTIYSVAIVERTHQEKLRVAKKMYNDELKEAEEAHASSEFALKNYHNRLDIIDNEYQTNKENVIKKGQDTVKKLEDDYRKEQEAFQKRIDNANNSQTIDYYKKQISDDKVKLDDRKKYTTDLFEFEVDALNKQKKIDDNNAKDKSENSKELLAIQAEYDLKYQKIVEERFKNGELLNKQAEADKKAIDDYLQSFVKKFESQSGFSSLFKILNKEIKGFGTNWKVTFVAMAEVAKEAFSFINKASEKNYQGEYDRLQRQHDISIAFAGNSASARTEIDRQYEEERKKIARKQAESKKQEAEFDIILSTAQAIMVIWAKKPDPTGISQGLMTAIIAGIGAAELAMVASAPLPQYFTGRESGGSEWAIVDELRPEVHTDSKGNIKSMGSEKGANLRFLEAGDKIYKSHEDYFNKELGSILAQNKIDPFDMNLQKEAVLMINNNNGMSKSDFDSGISKLASIISNKQEVEMNISKKGLEVYVKEGHTKKQQLNDLFTSKGKKV